VGGATANRGWSKIQLKRVSEPSVVLVTSSTPSHLTSLINLLLSPSFSSITTPTFIAVPRMACLVALNTDARVIARGFQGYILFTLLTSLQFPGILSNGTFSQYCPVGLFSTSTFSPSHVLPFRVTIAGLSSSSPPPQKNGKETY
jgi:hypothetical protein